MWIHGSKCIHMVKGPDSMPPMANREFTSSSVHRCQVLPVSCDGTWFFDITGKLLTELFMQKLMNRTKHLYQLSISSLRTSHAGAQSLRSRKTFPIGQQRLIPKEFAGQNLFYNQWFSFRKSYVTVLNCKYALVFGCISECSWERSTVKVVPLSLCSWSEISLWAWGVPTKPLPFEDDVG